MSVTVPSKVQENVQDVYRDCVGYKTMPEDLIEKWIKRELKIK